MSARESKGGRVVVLLLLGLLVLCGIGYAAAYWSASDRVPRGATVSGVKVGGKTETQAIATLERELGPDATRPMDVSLDGQTKSLDPADAGLAIDYAASVAQVGGERSWDPRWLWDYFTGGDEVEAVVDSDTDALDAALSDLASDVEQQPKDGAVSLRGGEVRVTQARTGRTLDLDAARDAVQAAYLTDDAPTLPITAQEPDISAADVRTAVDDFANPAVSGPVRLSFGQTSVRLEPKAYAAALRLVAKDGVLAPELDEKKLFALVDAQVSQAGAPVDATVRLVDGAPQVVPGKPGVGYEDKQLAQAFMKAVASTGERTATVKATVKQPEFTTADARKLGIKEKVSTFTTYFPYAEYRNVNLGRAAELINGTVLKPGETFSLNDTVGERTVENGFTTGYIINDGIIVADLGGGVSQIATTTFNAMFFAGLKDVEHKPHSFYIDRYPVGREATVAWGAVDLRFQNDTPYGVLVQANVTPSTPSSSGVVTVSMWSTKYWDITTKTGERYNITQAKTREVDTQECHAATGYGGFDIDVWRYFSPVGSNEQTRPAEKFHTTYIPSDTVVCTNPNATDSVQ